MHRLNIKVTEEAFEILQAEGKRIGTSMGTIVTLWALDKKKELGVIGLVDIYKQEQAKKDADRPDVGPGRVL
jgi:hypothetical protein